MVEVGDHRTSSFYTGACGADPPVLLHSTFSSTTFVLSIQNTIIASNSLPSWRKRKWWPATSNSTGEVQEIIKPVYAWKSDLRAFDNFKASIKGIADAGLAKIPEIFVSNPNKHQEKPGSSRLINVPVINFGGIDEDATLRKEIIEKVRDASEKLGFFQVVNHGIPSGVMEEPTDGIRRFHEQDAEAKKQFYSRDNTKSGVYI